MKLLSFSLAGQGLLVSMGGGDGAGRRRWGESLRQVQDLSSDQQGSKTWSAPVLNGVVGRKKGSYPDYHYSDANKNSGITSG